MAWLDLGERTDWRWGSTGQLRACASGFTWRAPDESGGTASVIDDGRWSAVAQSSPLSSLTAFRRMNEQSAARALICPVRGSKRRPEKRRLFCGAFVLMPRDEDEIQRLRIN